MFLLQTIYHGILAKYEIEESSFQISLELQEERRKMGGIDWRKQLFLEAIELNIQVKYNGMVSNGSRSFEICFLLFCPK